MLNFVKSGITAFKFKKKKYFLFFGLVTIAFKIKTYSNWYVKKRKKNVNNL